MLLLESFLCTFILSCHFLNDHWNDENNKYFLLKGHCIQMYLPAIVPYSLGTEDENLSNFIKVLFIH